MKAGFFRLYQTSYFRRLPQKAAERVAVTVEVGGLPEAQTGMILNLADLNLAHERVQKQLLSSDFLGFQDLALEAQRLWKQELLSNGHELQSILIHHEHEEVLLSWRSGQSEVEWGRRVWCRFQASDQVRQGGADFWFWPQAFETSLPLPAVSATVANLNQIAEALSQVAPASHRALFRDEGAGESWGFTNE